jgi:hypothetical protein
VAGGWLKDGLIYPKMLVLLGYTAEEILFLVKDCKMGRQSILNRSQDLLDIGRPEPAQRLSQLCLVRDHLKLICECREDFFL